MEKIDFFDFLYLMSWLFLETKHAFKYVFEHWKVVFKTRKAFKCFPGRQVCRYVSIISSAKSAKILHFLMIFEKIKNLQKCDFLCILFGDFSNFLQGLRYYLGYQNSLNLTYLKGSRWYLKPRKWFSHLYSMLEINGLWPKYAFRPIFPLPSKISKKRCFLMIFPTSSKV